MSHTTTQTIDEKNNKPITYVLRLKHEKGNDTKITSRNKNIQEKTVTWDDKVIDNEHMNKKKINCCAFCKKKKYDGIFIP